MSLTWIARPAWRIVTRPVGTVRAVGTVHPHVVITYDDGPDPVATGPVLEMLARHGATATFFVLVPRVRRHRETAKEILAAGHEIGLHGLDHTRLTTLPVREVYRRSRDGKSELEQLIGEPVRWFRAPYGALLPAHWAAVRLAGMMPVAWGPTPGDWRELPEEELASHAMQGCASGEILLAHDGFAVAEDGAFDGPAPAIDRGRLADLMLTRLAERGLTGRSLTASLREGGRARRWAWFIR